MREEVHRGPCGVASSGGVGFSFLRLYRAGRPTDLPEIMHALGPRKKRRCAAPGLEKGKEGAGSVNRRQTGCSATLLKAGSSWLLRGDARHIPVFRVALIPPGLRVCFCKDLLLIWTPGSLWPPTNLATVAIAGSEMKSYVPLARACIRPCYRQGVLGDSCEKIHLTVCPPGLILKTLGEMQHHDARRQKPAGFAAVRR